MSRSVARTLLGATLLLAACNTPVTINAVPGTYVMNKGRAADTLVVRADHSYERRYAMPGSAAEVDRGTWSVDSVDGAWFVTFDRFRTRWHAEIPPERDTHDPVFWPVTPERTTLGSIVLGVNADLGWEYRKVSVAF